MSEAPGIRPLLPALRDLCAWLEAARAPGMVIGGVAVALVGRPRFTRDIDVLVLVEQERRPGLLSEARRHGFVPRIQDAMAFAAKKSMLPLRHATSGVEVVVSFGALPFEKEAIARISRVQIQDISVPLPNPEDLIVMKAVAHRPQDMADIASVLKAHPDLNLRRVRRKVGEFARLMEQPEVLTDLEGLIARCRKRHK